MKTKIVHHHACFRRLIAIPWNILRKYVTSFLLRSFADKHMFDHIAIWQWRIRGLDYPDFVSITIEALRFIKKHDTLRYSRLKRYVRSIASTKSCVSRGYYVDVNRMILISFNHFQGMTGKEMTVVSLAGTMVHEITHAYLQLGKQIPHNDKTHISIERLCSIEKINFLKKAHVGGPIMNDALQQLRNWNLPR